mmetsp:Transcript_9350/g.15533  ORF Transcript_9350/g.15533 Transcript_9350/m.15533 type:complete len:282 (+) Transcript_9350:1067-1912(+)
MRKKGDHNRREPIQATTRHLISTMAVRRKTIEDPNTPQPRTPINLHRSTSNRSSHRMTNKLAHRSPNSRRLIRMASTTHQTMGTTLLRRVPPVTRRRVTNIIRQMDMERTMESTPLLPNRAKMLIIRAIMISRHHTLLQQQHKKAPPVKATIEEASTHSNRGILMGTTILAIPNQRPYPLIITGATVLLVEDAKRKAAVNHWPTASNTAFERSVGLERRGGRTSQQLVGMASRLLPYLLTTKLASYLTLLSRHSVQPAEKQGTKRPDCITRSLLCNEFCHH